MIVINADARYQVGEIQETSNRTSLTLLYLNIVVGKPCSVVVGQDSFRDVGLCWLQQGLARYFGSGLAFRCFGYSGRHLTPKLVLRDNRGISINMRVLVQQPLSDHSSDCFRAFWDFLRVELPVADSQ
jgi:hypothetical protein